MVPPHRLTDPDAEPEAPPPPPRRRPRVIVTRRLPDPVELRLKELFDTTLNARDVPFSQAQLQAALAEATVLVPTVTDRLDAATLAAAGPGLKLIASFGTGVDHIDLAACQERGILVSNTPHVLTEDTADMVLALMLAVLRRVVEGDRLLREGRWAGWGPVVMLGTRLTGKRLGIIGMGRIGLAVAERARAFGCKIHYHSRRPLPEGEAERLEACRWEDLDEMLAHMDIVSINTPLTRETRNLLSAERLDRLPRHAVLINTARGGILDEAALAERLATGRLGGAGLDVFQAEPGVHPALLALPNVVLTPHIASATEEARRQMGERVLVNIRAVMDGHKPPDWVIADLV